MRVTGDPEAANNGRHYLYADHLGSINAIQRQNGALEQMRYTPFGGYRQGGPNIITDRAYTGQRENMELGLYYYNARFYAPGVGRFLSADTIVPDPANPQSLNRYAYVLNSPINFSDPSGHRECGATDNCNAPLPYIPNERRPIEVTAWEARLLAIAAFAEAHGHGERQEEAIVWVALNRVSGKTPIIGGFFKPNQNFGGVSRIAEYVLSSGQFAIGQVISEEYGLLQIGRNDNWETARGLTIQEVVLQTYKRLNDFYNGGVDDTLDTVNKAIATYNSNGIDPTLGAVWYGHVSPGKHQELNVDYLNYLAEAKGVSKSFRYRVINSERPVTPLNLIVNNLIYVPSIKYTPDN